MKRKPTINETDEQILNHLKQHGRLTPIDISKELKLPYLRVWHHIQKLERYNKVRRRGNNFEISDTPTTPQEALYEITEARIKALSPAGQQIARDCLRYGLWKLVDEKDGEAGNHDR